MCQQLHQGHSELVHKFTLSSANSILFVQGDSFKLLSSPKLALDDGGLEILIGINGTCLFHPSPISILARDATSRALTLLLVSSSPTDPSALHFLSAHHYISETITVERTDDDDLELVDSVTFLFLTNPDTPNFEAFKVAALLVAVPLLPGHSIDLVSFSDDISITVLLDGLQDISQHHAEWANAMLLHNKLYAGQSLQLTSPSIPPAFLDGLPDDKTYQSTIFVMATPVSPSSSEGKDLLR